MTEEREAPAPSPDTGEPEPDWDKPPLKIDKIEEGAVPREQPIVRKEDKSDRRNK